MVFIEIESLSNKRKILQVWEPATASQQFCRFFFDNTLTALKKNMTTLAIKLRFA
jgi:hypothetical protein